MISLTATLVLLGGTAHAQNDTVATLVPGHVYGLRGVSFGNGEYAALELPAMFFLGPIERPFALVARGVVGVGASGGGIGFAVNMLPRCPKAEMCRREDDDYFMGPFFSVEERVERTYLPVGWRRATYAGPRLSVSIFVLKVSLGWMVDVTDRSNAHVQVGVGAGF